MKNIKIIKSPFMCYCAKVIPLAFDESMSYYECLCNFYNYLRNQVMPVINNNADALEELQNYVKNYFDNLDVQDEINNKLDEMAESGQLENLITQYLELQNTYTYNNVNEMKQATNLIDNSFARTSGFNSYNDGGGAYYKVREKEENEIPNEITLIELENDLVAELIKTNIIDIKQLGVFPSVDNTDDLNEIASILIELNPMILLINGNYNIGDTVTWSNLHDIKLEFKETITAKSYDNTEKPIFDLINCSNITFDNYNVTSTCDKQESAPAGHTRQSYLGSCRIGIKLTSCENIYLNNCTFTNMYWDLFPHGSDENTKTKNVYLNNTISNNSSIPVYASNLDGFHVNNFICKPKNLLGAGNHVFYISHDSDNLSFNNINIETDGYFGFSFAFNNDLNTSYKNISLSNIYLKGTGGIFCSTELINFTVSNFRYDYVDSLVGTNEILQFATGEINIRNSVFNNNTYRLVRLNTGCNFIMDNVIHNMVDENSNNQCIVFGNTNNNVTIKNSKIKSEILFYNSYANTLLFKDCEFYTTTSQYFQSTRNNNSKVTYINCIIKFSNNQNFSSQGSSTTYPNTVDILSSYLYGYNQISNNSNDDGFTIINSYKNNTLITTW